MIIVRIPAVKLTLQLCLCAVILSACEQKGLNKSTTFALTKNLNNLFEAQGENSSGTVVIGHNDEIVYSQAFGVADRTWDIQMETDYRFDIASINKSMVGVLVMIGVEEGILSLDDTLTDLLNSYEYTGTFDDGITLHHMLTHTSGLPDYDAVTPELRDCDFRGLKRMHFSNEEYVNFISRLDRIGEPGKQFHYSNFTYHLLCIILEDRYGISFGDLLDQKILQPLEMNDTFSSTDSRRVLPNLAKGYNLRDQEWKENPFIDLSLGRRVFSTSSDLFKWANAFNDTTILKQESLSKIKTNHLKSVDPNISYGYGWVVYDRNDEFSIGNLSVSKPYIIHGGSTDGYKSLLVNINLGEWVIAILSNSGDSTNELELGRKAAKILTGQRNK